MERETGIEPATNSLGSCDSTTELLPRSVEPFYNIVCPAALSAVTVRSSVASRTSS